VTKKIMILKYFFANRELEKLNASQPQATEEV
jgi:hypothetical protein